METKLNDDFYNQLFTTVGTNETYTYIGFDMSGSMFGNGSRNWEIQTSVIADHFEKNKLKYVQAFGWSSSNGDKNYGVIQCPLFISKKFIIQYMEKITNGNMTEPSTFFSKLIDYLKVANVPTDKNITIIFSTDGVIQVTSGTEKEKIKLKTQIKLLKELYPKTSIEIHVIDPTYLASTTSELKIGKDVFNVVMDIATEEIRSKYKIITKVIVHTSETNSNVELNQLQTVEDDMLPYDGKIFLKKSVSLFYDWFSNEVKNNAKSEDNLCNLLLKLAETLSYLIANMVPEKINQIVQNYSNLFTNTDIGFDAAEILIRNICDQALLNRSFLKKDIRIIVQKFFEESQKALITDARKALDLDKIKYWTSLPINNKLFYGLNDLADTNTFNTLSDLVIGKNTFSKCAICIGYNNNIMMIPVYDTIDPLVSQCFRQYIRSCLSVWLKDTYAITLDMSKEELIYIFGTIMLIVVMSDCPDFIKDAYRKCFKIMLQKKATNTTFITLLQELLEGKLSSGNTFESFERKMEIPLKMLKISESKKSMYVWYAICTASEIPQLADAQFYLYIKCYPEIFDFTEFKTSLNSNLNSNLTCIQVFDQLYYDKIITNPIILSHVISQPNSGINSNPNSNTKINTKHKTIKSPKIKYINITSVSKNVVIYFRSSVDNSVLNEVISHMTCINEFDKRNIIIAYGIGSTNLSTFIHDVNAESNIIIFPNKDIKPCDLNIKEFTNYKTIRVVNGMSCNNIIDLLRMYII